MFRTLFIAAVLMEFGCVSMSWAQYVERQDKSGGCPYNFASSNRDMFFSYCITTDGNVANVVIREGSLPIISPPPDAAEGYGVCNQSPVAAYFDYGKWGLSGNWDSPTALSHSATSVTIARTTTDGNWTLTQTFTLIPTTPSVKLVMALKNNTSAMRRAYLIRWVSFTQPYDAYFDGIGYTAFGWHSTFEQSPGWGLQLRNVGPPWSYVNAFAQNVPTPPNPCNFEFNWNGLSRGGSLVLAYAGNIGAGKTKKATMIYRSM